MRSVGRYLWWFLLVPYFAVQLIPSRPLPGVSQEFHDRLRGQGIVMVIVIILSLWLLRFSIFGHSRWREYTVAAFLSLFVGAVVATLINSRRDEEYRPQFEQMPIWKRCAFGFSTLGLMIASLILVPVARRPASSAPAQLHCSDAAQEMSADDCTAQ